MPITDYTKAHILANSRVVKKYCGVYFLILDDEIIYIGQTKNFYDRMGKHSKSINFDKVTFLEVLEKDLVKHEGVFIKKFKPKLNNPCRSYLSKERQEMYDRPRLFEDERFQNIGVKIDDYKEIMNYKKHTGLPVYMVIHEAMKALKETNEQGNDKDDKSKG